MCFPTAGISRCSSFVRLCVILAQFVSSGQHGQGHPRLLAVLLLKLPGKVGTNGWPFGCDDAVDARITERAVLGTLVAAQNAIELGSQPFNRSPALLIEKMSPKLYGQTVKALERMGQEKELCFRVQRRSLSALRIPS